MKSFLKKILFIVLALTAHTSFSQEEYELHESFSLGVSAGEYGYDSDIGIELGTPSLLKNRISFRMKGNLNWLEAYKATHDHGVKYKSFDISIIYNTPVIDRRRVYFELGTYYIFPNRKFSDRNSVQGITCSAGIELFIVTKPDLNVSYYFRTGIGYIEAYAEKLEAKPGYGKGFVFHNGFRFYFLRLPRKAQRT